MLFRSRYIKDMGWTIDRFSRPTPKADWSGFHFNNENEESPVSRENDRSYLVVVSGDYNFTGSDEIAVIFLGHHYFSCLEWVVFEVRSNGGARDHEWRCSLVPFMDFGKDRNDTIKRAYASVTADRDQGPGKSDQALYVLEPTGVFAVLDAGPGKASGHAYVTAVFSTTSEDIGAFERGLSSGVIQGDRKEDPKIGRAHV
mgnify:CR=1 FL=1